MHVTRDGPVMRRSAHRWAIGVALSCVMTGAHGQLFEADSKRQGSSKMDIVITEVERRPHSSVIDIAITSVGSSVGSSFFLLCSIRQLARLRGDYRYVVKIEEKPKRGQMLVGFLRNASDSVAELGPEFAAIDGRAPVIDLDEFAQICDMTK
jgi:hypothetical protein